MLMGTIVSHPITYSMAKSCFNKELIEQVGFHGISETMAAGNFIL